MPSLALGLALLFHGGARGEGLPPSPSLMGPAGLNTVPTARMNPSGTLTAGVSTFGPYAHAAVSVQLAPALSFTLRRSGEISGKGSGAEEKGGRRPWPALDLKLRLVPESAHVPEISIGADAAFGERRTASEYLVASKRLGAFDITAGLGWGRMGESGEIANPLRLLGGHFARNREATDDGAGNGPADWLTGHRAGLFGGIEYFPSFLENASLKLDWSSGRWRAEKALIPGFETPAPWSVGARWSPLPWLDLGAGAAGGGVFMARASLRTNAGNWQRKKNPASDADFLSGPYEEDGQIRARVALAPLTSFPVQAGPALRALLRKADDRTQSLSLTPMLYGLRGPRLTLPRRAVEKALSGAGAASAEELWRGASFETDDGASTTAETKTKTKTKTSDRLSLLRAIQLQLDTRASLSEPDAGVLHRTTLIMQTRRPLFPRMGILWSASTRLALTDTSDRLDGLRPWPEGGASVLPGRFGAGAFAGLRVSVQDMFLGWTGTPAPGLYAMAAAGYVEEMYAGGGGEILWRPFGRTFALGAEGWGVVRRDPNTLLAQGLIPGMGASGFLKGWYEIPDTNLTASLKAGRYLAGDIGATLGLSADFRGGARVEGWVTATNLRDRDAWGEALPLSAGLRLTLPVGGMAKGYIPEGSAARIALEPMGRRAGAAIENPLPLHELTDGFSWRNLSRDWPEITGASR